MNRSFHRWAAACGLLFVSGLFCASASAQAYKDFHANAGGVCHAATPMGETFMDRAETGYLNIQTNPRRRGQNVLVVCNPVADSLAPYTSAGNPNPSLTVWEVDLLARNTLGTGNIDMSCTLYSSYIGSPVYSSETITVSLTADGSMKLFQWNDNGNYTDYYGAPLSIMCDVPAGVELNEVLVYQDNQ